MSRAGVTSAAGMRMSGPPVGEAQSGTSRARVTSAAGMGMSGPPVGEAQSGTSRARVTSAAGMGMSHALATPVSMSSAMSDAANSGKALRGMDNVDSWG